MQLGGYAFHIAALVLEHADEVDARGVGERVLVDDVSDLGREFQEREDLALGKWVGTCRDCTLLE